MFEESEATNGSWARWVLTASFGALLVAFLLIEPMRWSLPARFLFRSFDLYREGAVDYVMCMRVPLSRGEAEEFVKARFEPSERVPRSVLMDQAICPAPWWPDQFSASTLGHAVYLWPDGTTVEGSDGAVYEDGYLYFWSNIQ